MHPVAKQEIHSSYLLESQFSFLANLNDFTENIPFTYFL